MTQSIDKALSLFQFKKLFPDVVKSLQSDNFEGDFLATVFQSVRDGRLANEFHQQWNKMGRAEYEIEMFGLAPDLPPNALTDLFRSDHVNFWLNNIPAIFVSDSGMASKSDLYE